eukprot:10012889-Lingulodinium_polyedra.AAC.1
MATPSVGGASSPRATAPETTRRHLSRLRATRYEQTASRARTGEDRAPKPDKRQRGRLAPVTADLTTTVTRFRRDRKLETKRRAQQPHGPPTTRRRRKQNAARPTPEEPSQPRASPTPDLCRSLPTQIKLALAPRPSPRPPATTSARKEKLHCTRACSTQRAYKTTNNTPKPARHSAPPTSQENATQTHSMHPLRAT